MTEKERRERRLPPNPATVALFESMQKDTEEKLQRAADMVRPAFESLLRSNALQQSFRTLGAIAGPTSKIVESLRALSGPMNQASNIFAKSLETQKSINALAVSYREEHVVMPAIAFQRHARLHPDDREMLIEEISARVVRPTQLKSRAEYSLPSGATWEQLEIRFFDGHTVKVKWGDMPTQTFDYKDMGFLDRKTNNPDMKWEMLREMATYNGSLLVSHFRKSYHRTAKYQIAQRLKKFFNMQADPFEPYIKRQGYRVRFSLRRD